VLSHRLTPSAFLCFLYQRYTVCVSCQAAASLAAFFFARDKAMADRSLFSSSERRAPYSSGDKAEDNVKNPEAGVVIHSSTEVEARCANEGLVHQPFCGLSSL
jgi:hypothetical protein